MNGLTTDTEENTSNVPHASVYKPLQSDLRGFFFMCIGLPRYRLETCSYVHLEGSRVGYSAKDWLEILGLDRFSYLGLDRNFRDSTDFPREHSQNSG